MTAGRETTLEPALVQERPILFSGVMVRQILAGNKTQTRRIVNMDELRVRLPGAVRSDNAGIAELDRVVKPIVAKSGTWRASMNCGGAVSVADGRLSGKLGVKPGEFHFVCPYADGKTVLVDYGHQYHDKLWTILPTPGSRLWVRETWRTEERDTDAVDGIRFAADDAFVPIENTREAAEKWVIANHDHKGRNLHRKWRPSIHMPRWACRIILQVISVRIEWLREISMTDARAEGIPQTYGEAHIAGLADENEPSHFWDNRTTVENFANLWNQINGDRAPWETNPWVWVVTFARVRP